MSHFRTGAGLRRGALGVLLLLCLGWTAPGPEAGGGVASAMRPGDDGPEAVEIRIRAVDGLKFDLPRLSVAPGAQVRLVFENADPSGMQHNLVVTRPGAREEVVQQATALGAAGAAQHYVPASDLVLWATPVLDAGATFVLTFTAPTARGVYPYVCTFPGHGFVMYGALYVGEPMPALAEDLHVPPSVRAAGVPAEVEAVTRPKVYRYLMPESGPASIAVALPNSQNYCWDAGLCRLRYAWSGGFVDRSESLNGEGGKAMQIPARVLGDVYYRAGDAFPIRIGRTSGTPAVQFRGYRLVEGMPEFQYEVDGVPVREYLTPVHHGDGLVRTFTIGQTREPVYFIGEPGTGVRYEASAGTWNAGILTLSGREAERFVITMLRADAGEGTK